MSVKQEIIDLAIKLIKLKTVSGNRRAINRSYQVITNYLHDQSELDIKTFLSQEVKSLLIKSKGAKNLKVLFHGHIDVVAGHQNQFVPKIVGDKLYGRGSLDMKGSLATLLVLLKNQLINTNHGLLITSDEEIGGHNGAKYLVDNNLVSCKLFLTGEPTNLRLATEEKGVIWFTGTLKGQSTHASTPWSGKNPIWDLETVLNRIKTSYPPLKTRAWQTTVTPTIVDSQNSQNQIPEEIKVKLDCRYIPEDNPDKLVNSLKPLFNQLDIKLLEPPLKENSHPYIKSLHSIIKKSPTAVDFASDARFFGAANTPAILFGPKGKGVHGKSEWVSCQSLVDYYELLKDWLKTIKT